MEKSFCFGLAAGMLAGALLAVNSYRFRKFVCDSQNQVKESVEKMAESKNTDNNETKE